MRLVGAQELCHYRLAAHLEVCLALKNSRGCPLTLGRRVRGSCNGCLGLGNVCLTTGDSSNPARKRSLGFPHNLLRTLNSLRSDTELLSSCPRDGSSVDQLHAQCGGAGQERVKLQRAGRGSGRCDGKHGVCTR